jgi:hypothetical protein
MTDLERRLRAALASAAGPPPSGLMDGIRRRHRRYLRRLRAGCATAAAAVLVAGTLAAHSALTGPAGSGQAGSGPAGSGPTSSDHGGPGAVVVSPSQPAAPGTVLRDCQSSNFGTLGANWKSQSVHVGPVWFIYGRLADTHPGSRQLAGGKLPASAMIIAVGNGRTAVVTVAPRTADAFRFLPGFNNSNVYTLHEGAPGLTLSGCPKGPAGTHIPASHAPGLTMFWQGYITDLTGCLPLQVQALPGGQRVSVTLRMLGGSCSS